MVAIYSHAICGFQNLNPCAVLTWVSLTTPLKHQITLRSRAVSASTVSGSQSLSALLHYQDLPLTKTHQVTSYTDVLLPHLILKTSLYLTVPWLSLWLPTTKQFSHRYPSNLRLRSMTSSGRRPLFALSTPPVRIQNNADLCCLNWSPFDTQFVNSLIQESVNFMQCKYIGSGL